MQKLDFTTKPSHSQLCELTRFYRRCAMRGGIGFRAIYTGLRHFVKFALWVDNSALSVLHTKSQEYL